MIARHLFLSLLGIGLVVSIAGAASLKPSGGDIYFDNRNGLSCAGCHGIAGTGGGEGGINIPPLLGIVGPGLRYGDTRTLCRLLATGLTPERIRISNLMPYYRLSPAQCSALFEYTSSFAKPVWPSAESRLLVTGRIDNRSAGQAAWLKLIGERLDEANQAGGIYGRRFALTAGADAGAGPFVAIDFSNGASDVEDGTPKPPTIVLQARTNRPLVKAIESSPLDEVRAILATYPGETFVIVDPRKLGPDLDMVKTAVDEPKTKIMGDNECAAGSAEPKRAIILSMAATAEQGLSQLMTCKGVQSVAISLRNVSGEAIAKAAAAARLPASVSVFTPVPIGQQFSDIPNVVGRIIVEMARRMGANPTRSVQIEAFEQAWKLHARGDGALFAGASIAEVDPADLSARGQPLWHEAP